MPIHFNHQVGQQITPLQQRAIKEAYLSLYGLCGATLEDHVIFTSSGAEAVNHVVLGAYFDITRKTGKNHFLASSLDEAPAIMSMSRLQECGCVFQMVPATAEGKVTAQAIADMLTPRTALVSMSWANGLTGVIQPVAEIAQLCKERGVLFHVDATHIMGKGDFSVSDCGADRITYSGPMGGCGLLIIPASQEISPLILGGSEQGGMRGGNYSVPSLLEFAQWAKEERAHSDHYGTEVARLRTLFEEMIHEAFHIKPLFYQEPRVPHITSFCFPGAASDALYYLLLHKGLHATFGGGHLQHFSHILKACHLFEPQIHCGISFGFSHSVTEDEIRYGAERVVAVVLQLRKFSQHLYPNNLKNWDLDSVKAPGLIDRKRPHISNIGPFTID